MTKIRYDTLTQDLARKAANDVTEAIIRTFNLAEEDQKEAIAIHAAGSAIGALAAVLCALRGVSRDKSFGMAIMAISDLLVKDSSRKSDAEDSE